MSFSVIELAADNSSSLTDTFLLNHELCSKQAPAI